MPKRKQGVSASAFTKRDLKFTAKDFYTPTDLKDVGEKELRKEYTTLRDIAQKRLKRLLKEDPGNRTLQYHPAGFPKLADIKDAARLRLELADLSRFINTPSSTIAGQKKANEHREKVLIEHGFLKGDETKEEKRALMHFVNYVESVLHENVMYRAKWGERIRDDRFKDMIRRGKYGTAYQFVTADGVDVFAEQEEMPEELQEMLDEEEAPAVPYEFEEVDEVPGFAEEDFTNRDPWAMFDDEEDNDFFY